MGVTRCRVTNRKMTLSRRVSTQASQGSAMSVSAVPVRGVTVANLHDTADGNPKEPRPACCVPEENGIEAGGHGDK